MSRLKTLYQLINMKDQVKPFMSGISLSDFIMLPKIKVDEVEKNHLIAVLSRMRYRADGFKAECRRQRAEVKCTPLNRETL